MEVKFYILCCLKANTPSSPPQTADKKFLFQISRVQVLIPLM